MRKISPRWQFVIILAVLLFLWGGSALWHSCNRAELEAQEDDVQVLFPIEANIDSAPTLKMSESDSIAAKDSLKTKKKQAKSSSFKSEKIGKHHATVERDFLSEEIDTDIPERR